jgi:iron(III) transport system substrate-binding protein
VRTVAAGIESYEMLPDGTFDPVRDLLIRPDVKDDANWHGGMTDGFADKQKKYFFGFGLNSLPVAWVNRDFIPESQLKSVKDLLKPEFKGKISIQDLRTGAAVVGLGVIMGAEGFGPDFIRKIVKDQGAPIVKNSRQQVEWLVRGSHPIGLVITSDILTQFQAEGLGKNVVPLEEGLLTSSSGFGGLIAINKPPHPAARKLYANWVLTRQAQQDIANTVGYNSRRKDVKPGSPITAVDPKRLNEYIYSQKEELVPYYGEVIKLARELEQ